MSKWDSQWTDLLISLRAIVVVTQSKFGILFQVVERLLPNRRSEKTTTGNYVKFSRSRFFTANYAVLEQQQTKVLFCASEGTESPPAAAVEEEWQLDK